MVVYNNDDGSGKVAVIKDPKTDKLIISKSGDIDVINSLDGRWDGVKDPRIGIALKLKLNDEETDDNLADGRVESIKAIDIYEGKGSYSRTVVGVFRNPYTGRYIVSVVGDADVFDGEWELINKITSEEAKAETEEKPVEKEPVKDLIIDGDLAIDLKVDGNVKVSGCIFSKVTATGKISYGKIDRKGSVIPHTESNEYDIIIKNGSLNFSGSVNRDQTTVNRMDRYNSMFTNGSVLIDDTEANVDIRKGLSIVTNNDYALFNRSSKLNIGNGRLIAISINSERGCGIKNTGTMEIDRRAYVTAIGKDIGFYNLYTGVVTSYGEIYAYGDVGLYNAGDFTTKYLTKACGKTYGIYHNGCVAQFKMPEGDTVAIGGTYGFYCNITSSNKYTGSFIINKHARAIIIGNFFNKSTGEISDKFTGEVSTTSYASRVDGTIYVYGMTPDKKEAFDEHMIYMGLGRVFINNVLVYGKEDDSWWTRNAKNEVKNANKLMNNDNESTEKCECVNEKNGYTESRFTDEILFDGKTDQNFISENITIMNECLDNNSIPGGAGEELDKEPETVNLDEIAKDVLTEKADKVLYDDGVCVVENKRLDNKADEDVDELIDELIDDEKIDDSEYTLTDIKPLNEFKAVDSSEFGDDQYKYIKVTTLTDHGVITPPSIDNENSKIDMTNDELEEAIEFKEKAGANYLNTYKNAYTPEKDEVSVKDEEPETEDRPGLEVVLKPNRKDDSNIKVTEEDYDEYKTKCRTLLGMINFINEKTGNKIDTTLIKKYLTFEHIDDTLDAETPKERVATVINIFRGKDVDKN